MAYGWKQFLNLFDCVVPSKLIRCTIVISNLLEKLTF